MNVQYTEGLPDLPPFQLKRLHCTLHWFHMEQHILIQYLFVNILLYSFHRN